MRIKRHYKEKKDSRQSCQYSPIIRPCPVDTGRKLNVHKNVLCTFNLRSVSTGDLRNQEVQRRDPKVIAITLVVSKATKQL